MQGKKEAEDRTRKINSDHRDRLPSAPQNINFFFPVNSQDLLSFSWHLDLC